MPIIANNRDLVYTEETRRNAGVTEALAKKLGAITNFLNTQQMVRDDFKANGPYSVGVGSIGFDGLLVFPVNVEIVYIAMSNQKAGLSGTTEFDIDWLDLPNSNMGSIFSTTPKIDSTALDDSYLLTDVINAVDVVTVAGGTNPVVTKNTFLAGEAISCRLAAGMNGAQDAQINVFYRPIN